MNRDAADTPGPLKPDSLATEFSVIPESGGLAVIHESGAEGGVGCIRFAKDEKEAQEEIEKLKKAKA